VAHADTAVLPPALRQPSLFANFIGVAEKDLAGNGEDAGICKSFEQRRDEIGRDAHIAVQ